MTNVIYPDNEIGASVAIRRHPDTASQKADILTWDEAIRVIGTMHTPEMEMWYETERGYVLAYSVKYNRPDMVPQRIKPHTPKQVRYAD